MNGMYEELIEKLRKNNSKEAAEKALEGSE